MDNKILIDVIKKRNGHYCHALEVNDIWELQSILEALYNEFIKEYSINDIIQFFSNISIYCLNDNNENEVYNYNINEYLLSI